MTDQEKKYERSHLAALGILCAVTLFYGLWRLPLIGPDEPRYAEIARSMVRSGDWITPRLAGIEWFEKPALTYWLSAIGYRVIGDSEFAARVGIALFAALGVVMLYFAGARLRSARFGYLSGSVLASSGIWLAFGRVATFDLPLAVSIELALLAFLLWDAAAEGWRRKLLWGIFWFGLGLGVLAKGLVGVLLPLMIIGLYLLLTGGLRAILRPPGLNLAGLNLAGLLIGVAIFLATAAVWYGPMLARHGRGFVDEFFIAHHFQRYLTDRYRHPQPGWFFAAIAVAGTFPWSFVLLARLGGLWSRRGQLLVHRFEIFVWLWAAVPVIFFSFSGSKLPGYIMPVFPALAMLVALQLDEWWENASPSRREVVAVTLTAVAIFLVGVFLALRGPREMGIEIFTSFRLGGTAILVAIVWMMVWFLLNLRAATRFLPFGFAFVVVALVNLLTPVLAERESLRALGELATRQARPGERLVFFINSNHRLNYYATDLPLRDDKAYFVTAMSPEQIVPLIEANGGESILVASQRQWASVVRSSPLLRVEDLGEQRGAVKCSPRCDLLLLRARRNEEGERRYATR